MTARERVKPALNTPFFFTLESEGAKVKSQYAPQGYEFKYEGIYHEGQVAKPALTYLDPAAHDAIVKAHAQPGDMIRLLKTKTGDYAVTILGDSAEPPAPSTPAPTRQVRVLAPATPTYTNGHANGNGKAAAQPAPSEPPSESHPLVDLLYRCYVAAGRAQWRAYQTLKAEGVDIDPPIFEDIRMGGTSLFIDRREAQR